jgi:hypothetical protein
MSLDQALWRAVWEETVLQSIIMLLIFWFQAEADHKGALGRSAKVYKSLAETNRRLAVLSTASELVMPWRKRLDVHLPGDGRQPRLIRGSLYFQLINSVTTVEDITYKTPMICFRSTL